MRSPQHASLVVDQAAAGGLPGAALRVAGEAGGTDIPARFRDHECIMSWPPCWPWPVSGHEQNVPPRRLRRTCSRRSRTALPRPRRGPCSRSTPNWSGCTGTLAVSSTPARRERAGAPPSSPGWPASCKNELPELKGFSERNIKPHARILPGLSDTRRSILPQAVAKLPSTPKIATSCGEIVGPSQKCHWLWHKSPARFSGPYPGRTTSS